MIDSAGRIVQIIPAAGWRWKLTGKDGGEETWPLTCFALVERTDRDGTTEREVEGVDLRCDGLFGLVQEWARERRGDGLSVFVECLPPEPGGAR